MGTRYSLNGIAAALNAVKEVTRDNVTSSEEFSRRAVICQTCPMNRSIAGLSRIGQLLTTAARVRGEYTPLNGRMCRVCGCPLELLAASLPKNLHKDSPEEAAKRPAKCWLTAAAKAD